MQALPILTTTAVASVLLLWFLVSIPHQFRWRWWDAVARHDAWGLLPRWTFFAPNPGRHDLHIIYRDWRNADPDSWREFRGDPVGTPVRWLWNPDRFAGKALVDAGNAVIRSAALSGESNIVLIQLDPAYLQVLRWVMVPAPHHRADARQFALVRTQTEALDRPLAVVFVSFVHPLAR